LDTEELEDLDLLHCSPIVLLGLTDIEGEVVVLAPHCLVTDILPVG
jgi:hypothetical protein